jgi:hypothetical protein
MGGVSAEVWEVPFAKSGPAGVVGGTINIVVNQVDDVTVFDFKTDAVTAGDAKNLRDFTLSSSRNTMTSCD